MALRARARALFPLGVMVATPGALAALSAAGASPLSIVARHARGDWGLVCDDDAATNREALRTGARLLSAYDVGAARVWVITEADRSATTILLPEEY